MDFASLHISNNRRVETLAIAQFVFSFLALPFCCWILCLYVLLFTSYWPLVIAYFAFLYFDRDTPDNGGRLCYSIRNWRLWKHMSNYFPIKLHKTSDLDPEQNYIFGFHPHGVLCVGAFTNFCTNGSGFTSIFPGFTSYLTMLPLWFKTPLFRDYIMAGGLIPSSKKSVQTIISKSGGGNICCIIPGGALESLYARPGDVTLLLKNRFGFIKMAIKNGVSLVPVISFGEHALWDQMENPPGSRLRSFQEWLQKWVTITLPVFYGRGIFQYNFGLMPYRRSINTIVGRPIEVTKNLNPTNEEIQNIQEIYMNNLQELFDEHKLKYASDNCKLIIS